ncbi:unnamed protein product [Closterium sp. NIES-64]|nr:unnamed protein product [Closterium sp. NIES-64]
MFQSRQSVRFRHVAVNAVNASILLQFISLWLLSASSAVYGHRYERVHVAHKRLRGSAALDEAAAFEEWQVDASRVVQISIQPRAFVNRGFLSHADAFVYHGFLSHAEAFVYHGFLSHAECDHLIALSQQKLLRPGMLANGTFLRKYQDERVRAIEDRISSWLFLPRNLHLLPIPHYRYSPPPTSPQSRPPTPPHIPPHPPTLLPPHPPTSPHSPPATFPHIPPHPPSEPTDGAPAIALSHGPAIRRALRLLPTRGKPEERQSLLALDITHCVHSPHFPSQSPRAHLMLYNRGQHFDVHSDYFQHKEDRQDWQPTEPQLMRYNTGQQFDVHYDYFQHKEDHQVLHRAATLVLFLSDVERGGEVTFPKGKPERDQDFGPVSDCAKGRIAVRPRKGNALLYFHLSPNGYNDPRAYREDCPLLPPSHPTPTVGTSLGGLFRGMRGSSGSDGSAGAGGSTGGGAGGGAGGRLEAKWTAEKWVHMFKYMTRRSLLDCTDEHPNCAMWAAGGECKRNPGYMVGEGGYVGNCRKACKVCND